MIYDNELILKNLKKLRYGIFHSENEVNKLIDDTIEMVTNHKNYLDDSANNRQRFEELSALYTKNAAIKRMIDLEDRLKVIERMQRLYKNALTKAVSLPKGELPHDEQYYTCSLSGTVNVFKNKKANK